MGIIRLLRAAGLVLALGLAAPGVAQVSLDLRDADLRSFVAIVSEATGRNFVLDPNVRGTVTVIAPDGMPADALYEVFLGVLELNRLTLLEGREADRIVPLGTARELGTDTEPGLDGGYRTVVIEVEHIAPQEAVEVVRPLLPAEAVISAVPRSDFLILSDRAGNTRRIAALIDRLDQPQEREIRMIRLRNANAAEVLQVVQSLGIVPEGASVSVDRRSNALVVAGPDALVERIRVLAARLDTQRNATASVVEQVNYADAAALADVILRSVGQGEGDEAVTIVPEPATNSLLITGPEDRLGEIVGMIRHLDRRPAQVLVEAVVFEMSVDGFADLSAQFGAVINDAVVGGVQFSLEGRPTLTGLVSAVLAGETASPGDGGTFATYNDSGETRMAGLLSAISRSQSTRLLSTPSILTLNNTEAEIVVAQNVPFVTGSFATVGDDALPENPFQTIERKDVGLTLNVTPQISADGTIRLLIEQEVSNLTRAASQAGGEITARRALSTTVLVRDGNVIMLGGLLEDGSRMASQEVPGLSRLPLFGALFRGKNTAENQRVLLLMLRPRVVETDREGQQLSREVARKARRLSLAMEPEGSQTWPQTPRQALPYDGADLNQIFDAGFIDHAAEARDFPPLPSRLRFDGGE